MSEEQLAADAKMMSPWQRHRFIMLIMSTIVVSLFLVGVALALYASSGAAQLDLSRPGYKSVRDQAARSNTFEGFPATGTMNQDALNQFRKMYDQQAKNATNVDTFGGDVMSDKALSIDDDTTK
ncbi:MAG TPA: hypothetical protein VIQ80_03025 [Candidatus Saccharimonadales bacterium]